MNFMNKYMWGCIVFSAGMLANFALVKLTSHQGNRLVSAGAPPASQARIATVAQEVIYGREMVVLRDTETNAEYLYYGGGLTRLDKKP